MKRKNELKLSFVMVVQSVIESTNLAIDNNGDSSEIRNFIIDGMILEGQNPFTNIVVETEIYGTGNKKVIKVMNDRKIQSPILDENGRPKKDIVTGSVLFEINNPTILHGKTCMFNGVVSYYTTKTGEVVPSIRIKDYAVVSQPAFDKSEDITIPSYTSEANALATGLFEADVINTSSNNGGTSVIASLLGISEVDLLALKTNNPTSYIQKLNELLLTVKGVNKKEVEKELAIELAQIEEEEEEEEIIMQKPKLKKR